jgi:hypothetical protein
MQGPPIVIQTPRLPPPSTTDNLKPLLGITLEVCDPAPRLRHRTSENAKGTGESMILLPLCDLNFLIEFAAYDAATSNRRYR